MIRRVLFSAFVVALLAAAVPAFAQSDRSVWGFSGSFVPQWKVPARMAILFDAETIDVKGSEFRVGVVRGRPLGGDWGVSFVRKQFKEGSNLAEESSEFCGSNNTCVSLGSTALFQNVSVTGVEVHRFFPFATIKSRAQIGLTVAGGIGSWKGTGRVNDFDFVFNGNTSVIRPTVTDVPIGQLFILERSTIPLFRLELAGAALVSDNFKIRVSGGVNFPGTQVISVQGIFLLPQ
jgi:hypothetical protein